MTLVWLPSRMLGLMQVLFLYGATLYYTELTSIPREFEWMFVVVVRPLMCPGSEIYWRKQCMFLLPHGIAAFQTHGS